jgi:hypothetical protein
MRVYEPLRHNAADVQRFSMVERSYVLKSIFNNHILLSMVVLLISGCHKDNGICLEKKGVRTK